MLERHPLATWFTIVTAAIGFLASAVGIWWYIYDERERSIDQVERLGEIRREQEGIRKELAEQTLLLRVINDDFQELNRSLDGLEDGQEHLSSEISRDAVGIATTLGRLLEYLERR